MSSTDQVQDNVAIKAENTWLFLKWDTSRWDKYSLEDFEPNIIFVYIYTTRDNTNDKWHIVLPIDSVTF